MEEEKICIFYFGAYCPFYCKALSPNQTVVIGDWSWLHRNKYRHWVETWKLINMVNRKLVENPVTLRFQIIQVDYVRWFVLPLVNTYRLNHLCSAYKELPQHKHFLEIFFASAWILQSRRTAFPGDPGGRRIAKLPWIIIAHVSPCHRLQGGCVGSWLVPPLAGFSLCHLAPASCPPSCYSTSTHSKQLRGTNSEKPELWVTNPTAEKRQS